jgi:hypothetical protein
MVIGEIDSWIQMLECIAYNFFYCALKFNSKYFTFDHSLERNNVRNQELDNSGRYQTGACGQCSCLVGKWYCDL